MEDGHKVPAANTENNKYGKSIGVGIVEKLIWLKNIKN